MINTEFIYLFGPLIIGAMFVVTVLLLAVANAIAKWRWEKEWRRRMNEDGKRSACLFSSDSNGLAEMRETMKDWRGNYKVWPTKEMARKP